MNTFLSYTFSITGAQVIYLITVSIIYICLRQYYEYIRYKNLNDSEYKSKWVYEQTKKRTSWLNMIISFCFIFVLLLNSTNILFTLSGWLLIKVISRALISFKHNQRILEFLFPLKIDPNTMSDKHLLKISPKQKNKENVKNI